MKILRNVIFGIVGLLIVVLIVVAVILKTTDFNKYRGLIAEEVEKATGRALAISGDLDVHVSLSPSVSVDGVRFANASWGTNPNMVSVKHFEAEIKLVPLLKGDVEVVRIILDQPEILLETNKNGVGNWEFAEAEKPKHAERERGGERGAIPLIQEVMVKNGSLKYRDGQTGEETKVQLQEFSARAKDLASPLNIKMVASYDDIAASLQGKLASADTMMAEKPIPVDLSGEFAGATFSLQGTVDPRAKDQRLDLNVKFSSKNLADVGRALKAELPSLPLEMSAGLQDEPHGIKINNLACKVGRTDLAGNVAVRMGGESPQVTAKLTSQQVDVNEFMPAGEEGAKSQNAAKGAAKADKLFSAEPLPLEGLKAVNCDVSLSVASFLYKKLVVRDIQTTIKINNGALQVSPMSLKLADGTVQGKVSLDGSRKTPTLSLDLSGDSINLGSLLQQMEAGDYMQNGTMQFKVTGKSQGNSMHDLMAALDGNILVTINNGRLNNKAVDLAGADLVSELLTNVNPFAKSDEYTELQCAVVNFPISSGMMQNKTGLGMETSKMYVSGGGSVNFATEELDMAVAPSPRKGIGISAGSLAELVRLKGTLVQPKAGIDTFAAAKKAVSIGAALSTGGLSALGQALYSKTTEDKEPCKTALGQK